MKRFLALLIWLSCVGATPAADAPMGQAPDDLVPLILKLPPRVTTDCFLILPTNALIEPLSTTPRPPMMVPPGLKNLAPGAKVTCSDTNATAQTLAKLTDGDKVCLDEGIICLAKGTQWVQLDFGEPHELYAVVIWHNHVPRKLFHDVVVQLSDDGELLTGVETLFNNDRDNSSGRGIGTDREYLESVEGRLINAKGIKARYLRCYSKDSTESHLNQYAEIEVYGRPRKSGGPVR